MAAAVEFKSSARSHCVVPSSKKKKKEKQTRHGNGVVEGRRVLKESNYLSSTASSSGKNKTMTMKPVDTTTDFLHRSPLYRKLEKTKDFSTDSFAPPQLAPCFPQKQFQESSNEKLMEDSGKRSREDGSDSTNHKKDSYSPFVLSARRHNLEGQKQFQASFNKSRLEDLGKRSREDGSDNTDHEKDSYSPFILPARRHNLEGQKQFQASSNENLLEDSGKRSREDSSDSTDHKNDSYSPFLSPARRHNLEGQRCPNRFPARTNKAACTDDLEIQAEEKIIRPVFTERKAVIPDLFDLREQRLTRSNLSGIIHAEVWQAVTDIKNGLADVQSDGKCHLKQSSDPLDGDVTKETPDYDGVINELTQTCQDYADKLYESKNNVQSLRSELALEKHQCLEMAKLVKELELLPSPTSIPKALIRGIDKMFLPGIPEDVEATRKEEVIETEFLCRVCSGPEPAVTLVPAGENDVSCAPMQPALRRKSQTHEISEAALPLKASSNIVLNSQLSRDGIYLPWLQFDDEADFDIGFQLATDFRDDLRKQEACSGNNKYVHNIARRPLRMRLEGFSNLKPPQNWPCYNIRIGHALGAYSLQKDWARWRQSFVEAYYGCGYRKDYEREPRTFGNTAFTKILVLPFSDNHIESGVLLLCIGTLGSVQCRALASEKQHNLTIALEENISVGKYLSYPTTNYDDEQAFLKVCLG